MREYKPNSGMKLPGLAAQAGIVTKVPVSKEFAITAEGSKHFVAKIDVSGVNHTGTQTLMLQTAIGDDWQDSKTATFTADGIVYIKINVTDSDDWDFCPLLARGRIVLSQTHADDDAVIDSIDILQGG
jgi:hypothetical protein